MGGHLRLLCFFRQAKTSLAYLSMSQPHLSWAQEHLKIKTVHIVGLVWFLLDQYSFHIADPGRSSAGWAIGGSSCKKTLHKTNTSFHSNLFLIYSIL